ncbi:hypothetical protein MKW94_012030, partial [Papaver nudicaule]|nr:hypothetical protein [Papaver nudicaule]
MDDDLLRYYPTKGGLVKGKGKRVDHPNLEKMLDYRPEKELDFLPLLTPNMISSTDGSQASTILDPLQSIKDIVLDDGIFASIYSANEDVQLDKIPDEDQDSEDEELLPEPVIDDDDEEINLTGQIQATLASTFEFKEFVEETQNIDGEYKLSENQESVEKDYLKELAIEMNYYMVQVKNKKHKQSYKCKDETYEWKVYCSVLSDKQTFECKSGHFIHSCESYHGLKHSLANARWVAKVMLECYKAHPKYKPKDFQTEVKKNHKVKIYYYTAWHAYHLCNEKILGSYEEGYALLPALCDQIKGGNDGNIVSLRTDPTNDRFVSLCIAYTHFLDGFQGKYGGTLLAITSLDGNNGIVLIAVYICQSEYKETGIYFLSIMADELKQHPRALTFISNRQKGLIEGVSQNFSDVNHHHRYSFIHLYKNFKKSHPGKNLEFIVWRAARSFSEVGHKIWMEKLKDAKPSAPEWFDREPVESWVRCYFDRSSKCQHVTSNFCEAFNSWILPLRKLPICKLVEKYHLLMMRIFYDREQVGKKMTDGVVPRVTNIIKKHLYFSHEFTTRPSSKNIWAIFDTKKDISWAVNLELHTFTCNAWQVIGVPCVHAITAHMRFRTEKHD